MKQYTTPITEIYDIQMTYALMYSLNNKKSDEGQFSNYGNFDEKYFGKEDENEEQEIWDKL